MKYSLYFYDEDRDENFVEVNNFSNDEAAILYAADLVAELNGDGWESDTIEDAYEYLASFEGEEDMSKCLGIKRADKLIFGNQRDIDSVISESSIIKEAVETANDELKADTELLADSLRDNGLAKVTNVYTEVPERGIWKGKEIGVIELTLDETDDILSDDSSLEWDFDERDNPSVFVGKDLEERICDSLEDDISNGIGCFKEDYPEIADKYDIEVDDLYVDSSLKVQNYTSEPDTYEEPGYEDYDIDGKLTGTAYIYLIKK